MRGLSLGFSVGLQIELLVERGLALCGAHEELGGDGDEDAEVAGGMIGESLAKFSGHECGVTGCGEQVLQAGEQLLAGGYLRGKASTDARAERYQLFASQLLQEARIASDNRAKE